MAARSLHRRASILAMAVLATVMAGSATATVLGIDLGGQYMKMSVVRPGGTGIEIVTNEQAKRKTPTAIAFTTDNERLFGDEAIAYAGKKPLRVLMRTREFLGKCVDDLQDKSPGDCDRLPITIQDGSSSKADTSHELPNAFVAEEVTAMFVSLARKLTAAYIRGATGRPFAESALTDVVLTVPAWFGEVERTAVLDAVHLAGMNPLATVNVNTAAAMKYTLDSRGDAEKNKNETFLVIDIGATGTTASVGRIERGATPKEKVKLFMLCHAWDKSLGGGALDELVAKHLAAAFDKQRGITSKDTKSVDIPSVMARLRKESMRLREVLSANTEAYCSVEALFKDLDFSGSLTRKEFESMASASFDRVGTTIKEALKAAKVDASSVDTVIPFGGVTRIPKIQETILKVTKRDQMNKAINADEAAVLGAAFFGATLSSRFQVKKVDVFDILPYPIKSEIERETGVSKQAQSAELFPVNARVPSKKLMTVKRTDNFDVSVFKQGTQWLSSPQLLGKFSVSGVADVYKQLQNSTKDQVSPPKVAITFEVDRSGLVDIQKTEVTLEEVTFVEREVPIVQPKPSKSAKKDKKPKASAGATQQTAENGKPESAESSEPQSTTPSPSPSPNASESPSQSTSQSPSQSPKTKMETRKQTLVHRVFPKVELMRVPNALKSFKMSSEQLQTSKKKLLALDDAEKNRKLKADTLNTLEGFILDFRSKLNDEEFELISTEEEREKLSELFEAADDWLYTDDAKVTEKLLAKDKELKDLVAPALLRLNERTARPEAIDAFDSAMTIMKNETDLWRTYHVESNSNHVDTITKFETVLADGEEWLQKLIEKQEQIAGHEEPVLTSKMVKGKLTELVKGFNQMLKNTPRPKQSPSPTASEATQEPEQNPEDSEESPGRSGSPEDSEAPASPVPENTGTAQNPEDPEESPGPSGSPEDSEARASPVPENTGTASPGAESSVQPEDNTREPTPTESDSVTDDTPEASEKDEL